MSVSEQMALALLRVCSQSCELEHRLAQAGVTVVGVDAYAGIVDALLDEVGAPTGEQNTELRSHLHDVLCDGFMDGAGEPNGGGDLELLVAWRTMLSELRNG